MGHPHRHRPGGRLLPAVRRVAEEGQKIAPHLQDAGEGEGRPAAGALVLKGVGRGQHPAVDQIARQRAGAGQQGGGKGPHLGPLRPIRAQGRLQKAQQQQQGAPRRQRHIEVHQQPHPVEAGGKAHQRQRRRREGGAKARDRTHQPHRKAQARQHKGHVHKVKAAQHPVVELPEAEGAGFV